MLDLINKICKELPGDFIIKINMEYGAAWVTMKHRGRFVRLDIDDLPLEEQLRKALKVVKEWDNKMKGVLNAA